jgi:hypothetical protein
MKKLLFPVVGLMLFFSSCNEDVYQESGTTNDEDTFYFYGVKEPDKSTTNTITTKAVAQHSKIWNPGDVITVKFIETSLPSGYENIIKAAAAEWEVYANIEFKFVASGDADIRITFASASRFVTWSYTGTDCKSIPQSQPTINFAGWNSLSADDRKGDALRCLGQALGLEFEYRYAGFDPDWVNGGLNAQVFWSMLGVTDILWPVLKEYVFDPLSPSLVGTSIYQSDDYDYNSIMNYPFSPMVIANNPNLRVSRVNILSDTDKSSIAKLYPLSLLIEAKIDIENENVTLSPWIGNDMPLLVKWGDGTESNLPTSFTYYSTVSHTYSVSSIYTLEIYGRKNYLRYLNLQCSYLTELTLYENTEFKELYCGRNKLYSLDVSQLPKLECLDFHANFISSISLQQNPELTYFGAAFNNLSTLDISNNKKIAGIEININPILNSNSNLADLIIQLPNRTYDIPYPLLYPDIKIPLSSGMLWCDNASFIPIAYLDLKNWLYGGGGCMYPDNCPRPTCQ